MFRVLKSDWDTAPKSYKKSTLSSDKNDLKMLIDCISNKNVHRASSAIVSLLSEKSNRELKDAVIEAIVPTKSCSSNGDSMSQLVIKGMRSIIKHHDSRSQRSGAGETVMKHLVAASLFHIEKENINVSNRSIEDFLGVTHRQVKSARKIVQDMINNNKQGVNLQRKVRSDYIRPKLKPYVYDFLKDDEYTRLDTSQGLVDVIDPRTGKTVTEHMRIWINVNKEEQRRSFIESTHYQNFQIENDGATAVSVGIWKEVLDQVGQFVVDPIQRSCVDEKISGLQHMMCALVDVLKVEDTKRELENHEGTGLSYSESLDILKTGDAFAMVCSVCCERTGHPEIHIDKTRPCPKFIPFLCTHGNGACSSCGLNKKLAILDELSKLSKEDDKFEVKCWKDSIRSGVNSKGEQNKQRELSSEWWTIEQLVTKFKFKEQMKICLPHCQEIRWIRHILNTDFTRLPAGTLLILTDFAASMCLRAAETKNSSVDAHAVNDNFVCIYNRCIITLNQKRKRSKIEILDGRPYRLDVRCASLFRRDFLKGQEE